MIRFSIKRILTFECAAFAAEEVLQKPVCPLENTHIHTYIHTHAQNASFFRHLYEKNIRNICITPLPRSNVDCCFSAFVGFRKEYCPAKTNKKKKTLKRK